MFMKVCCDCYKIDEKGRYLLCILVGAIPREIRAKKVQTGGAGCIFNNIPPPPATFTQPEKASFVYMDDQRYWFSNLEDTFFPQNLIPVPKHR